MTDLPEPHKLFTERTGHPVYTATQMREYRNQALEEAAKVCDELAELNRESPTDSMWEQEECAAAIRALKGN